jgi:hypothetical protein
MRLSIGLCFDERELLSYFLGLVPIFLRGKLVIFGMNADEKYRGQRKERRVFVNLPATNDEGSRGWRIVVLVGFSRSCITSIHQ